MSQMDYAKTYKEYVEAHTRERARAENIADWPFRIPRETMDQILADSTLGVREHLALAATCPALRRMYHNNDIFKEVVKCRFLPIDGRPKYAHWEQYGRSDTILQHIATRRQKRKGNGPFMKAIGETYMVHREALQAARKHRITAAKAKEYYPNLTNKHLSLLKYYERNHRGYPNQWTDEGYMETAVDWLSIRVRRGWSLPGLERCHDGESATNSEPPILSEGSTVAGTKRETAEEHAIPAKKARRS